MKTVEYHVERTESGSGFKVIACFGLLDVKILGVCERKKDAIQFCKDHATRHGFKPLILS